MDFPQSIKSCLYKYVEFGGRSARSEYWWFTLFSLIVHLVAITISDKLYLATTIALLLPSIAVSVRRLHDKDKSGWWLLLCLVPILGLILIVWFCQKGTEGSNSYGNDPLAQ